MQIVFVGGDARMRTAAQLLAKEGHSVRVCGLNAPLPSIDKEEIFAFAEAIILPTPASKDGSLVLGTDIPLSFFSAHPTVPLFAGALPPSFLRDHPLANDFLTDETLALTGAALTAQGGIATALAATQRGFYRMRAAILGYGRIATFLTRGLEGFGVPVSVYARRGEVRTNVSLLGYTAKALKEEVEIEEELVFNTVPTPIFEKVTFSKDAFVFDLGGGLRGYKSHFVTSLPSLPGKFAPLAAGEAIYELLSAFFRKEGSL